MRRHRIAWRCACDRQWSASSRARSAPPGAWAALVLALVAERLMPLPDSWSSESPRTLCATLTRRLHGSLLRYGGSSSGTRRVIRARIGRLDLFPWHLAADEEAFVRAAISRFQTLQIRDQLGHLFIVDGALLIVVRHVDALFHLVGVLEPPLQVFRRIFQETRGDRVAAGKERQIWSRAWDDLGIDWGALLIIRADRISFIRVQRTLDIAREARHAFQSDGGIGAIDTVAGEAYSERGRNLNHIGGFRVAISRGRRPPGRHPGVEVLLGYDFHLEPHPGMSGAAELSALAEIFARRAGHELHWVVVSRDHINLAAELGHPEGGEAVFLGNL